MRELSSDRDASGRDASGRDASREGRGAHVPSAHPVSYSEATMTQLMVRQCGEPAWHRSRRVHLDAGRSDRLRRRLQTRRPADRDGVSTRWAFAPRSTWATSVTLHARVNHVGRSSMEIGVRVEAEDLLHVRCGTRTPAMSRWWRWTRRGVLCPCRVSCSRPRRSARVPSGLATAAAGAGGAAPCPEHPLSGHPLYRHIDRFVGSG